MRRLLAPISVLALLAAACGERDIRVEPGEQPDDAFVVQIAEFAQDAGAGVSLTADAEGHPHLAYLAFPEEPEGGGPPAAPAPGEPTLPAVKHAHFIEGRWTRGAVAGDRSDLEPGDRTAIAVDAQGKHHIAWTEGGDLFYSDDPTGEAEPFAFPNAGASAVAPAVAADEGGKPYIAFWAPQTSAEGPTALLRLATLSGEEWSVQTVAEGEPGEPFSIGLAIVDDGPVVAYGSGGETLVATQDGEAWASETVDEEGGLGVSMSVDSQGNPHVAFLNAEGQVHHAHSIDGGEWETSEVAPDADFTAPTSIAVDPEGIHHVAWETGGGVAYANNAGGEFAAVDVEGGAGGTSPKVAAGAEGVVHLAWYDTTATALKLATRGGESPLLAVPSAEPDAGGGDGGGTGPPACQPEGTELSIAASGLEFDKDCLAAPAGQAFTIAFDNQDTQPHNVSIYTEANGETLFEGELIQQASITYNVDALEAGNLYFQCDVHPNMNGDFAVV